ncbi:hypothetical protein LIER_13939 [Lithospermum erythrorhizon]|uniref:Reverse transcriptase Ty1/copia-type domain-containing protein n=1 Tax=Lithospermum erythrorhizon TaxID=34254 RepID=A0AAV3Q1T9_LITER
MESHDAVFDENRFTTISRPRDLIVGTRISGHQNIHNELDSPNRETSQVRRRKRARISKGFGTDFFMFLMEGSRETKSVNSYVPYCYNLDYDPITFKEAKRSLDAPFWKEAIDGEMDSVMGHRILKLASLPPGCKSVGYKCVYCKFNGNKGVAICLYVDDMLIFGTDLQQVEETKNFLSIKFFMKYMGIEDVFGIKITRSSNGLTMY